MARAHRIGKTMYVCVSRLLTNKTYEMNIFHSSILKRGLDRAVLAHQRQNTEYDGSVKYVHFIGFVGEDLGHTNRHSLTNPMSTVHGLKIVLQLK